MGTTTSIMVTQPTVIGNVLRAPGWTGDVDLMAEFGVSKIDKKSMPNVVAASKAGDPVVYEQGALGPTGPNPENAQANPAGSVMDGSGTVAMPAEPGGAPAAVVAETPAS